MAKHFISKSEAETINLGKRLGATLHRGDIIALCGELGSGKTVLVKGIAKGLGIKSNKYVNSPSFVILKEYKGRLPLYHFDIYRLDDMSEFSTIGYTDYFYGGGISVIEWADKISGVLPRGFLRIDISITEEKTRKINIKPHGIRYEKLAEKL
jgi:tRNA threonylcarbamoyladenosine biosynthesis protein TsaE